MSSSTLIAIFIFIAIAILFFLQKSQIKAFKDTVKKLGFKYKTKDPLPKQILSLKFVGLRNSGFFAKAENLIYGDLDNTKFSIFNYGKNHRQSYLMLSFKDIVLPNFNLYPKCIGKKLDMSIFKYKRIRLDQTPEFNEKYLLYGENESALNMLFKDELISFLNNTENFSFEGRMNTLLFYQEGSAFNVKNIATAIPLSQEVNEVFIKTNGKD